MPQHWEIELVSRGIFETNFKYYNKFYSLYFKDMSSVFRVKFSSLVFI